MLEYRRRLRRRYRFFAAKLDEGSLAQADGALAADSNDWKTGWLAVLELLGDLVNTCAIKGVVAWRESSTLKNMGGRLHRVAQPKRGFLGFCAGIAVVADKEL